MKAVCSNNFAASVVVHYISDKRKMFAADIDLVDVNRLPTGSDVRRIARASCDIIEVSDVRMRVNVLNEPRLERDPR